MNKGANPHDLDPSVPSLQLCKRYNFLLLLNRLRSAELAVLYFGTETGQELGVRTREALLLESKGFRRVLGGLLIEATRV